MDDDDDCEEIDGFPALVDSIPRGVRLPLLVLMAPIALGTLGTEFVRMRASSTFQRLRRALK